ALNRSWWEWDWPGADAEFRRSLAANSSSSETHRAFALMLARTDRLPEALDQIDSAIDLDPLNSPVHGARATILLYAGRVDDALDEYQSVTRLDPSYLRIYIPMSDALEAKGRIGDAIEATRRGVDLGGRENYALANLGRLYAL